VTEGVDRVDQVAAFGRWLTRERELRGLSRDEVVRSVKLAAGVVEALESGDAARMPPRAYAVGYLRAYATAVGLDADEVVLRFEEATAPQVRAQARTSTGLPGRALGAVIVAVALVAALVWTLLRS
jgi:cytoskeletal protein RodZ